MPEPQIPQQPGKPLTQPVQAREPVIRTMPERYIGAPAGRPPVVREIVETRVVQETKPKVPPPPVALKPKTPVKKSRRILIIASVIVLLAGVSAVAYIVFTPVGEAPPPPPVNSNAPVENININIPPPPVPICGNAILESGEECDDGNLVSGDECSDICKLEPKAPPPPPTSGIDSDSDGLTDVEEQVIYGTDMHNQDSDGDSFNDGNEVGHLYDPSIKAPAILKDSLVVRTIESLTQGYSVLIPAKWTVRGQDSTELLATASTGEFLEVLVTEKPKDQSLVEWYLSMSPGAKPDEVDRVKTMNGYDALRSPDRLTTFIDVGTEYVFTLTLSFSDQDTLDYRNTYEMFVASFTMLKP